MSAMFPVNLKMEMGVLDPTIPLTMNGVIRSSVRSHRLPMKLMAAPQQWIYFMLASGYAALPR